MLHVPSSGVPFSISELSSLTVGTAVRLRCIVVSLDPSCGELSVTDQPCIDSSKCSKCIQTASITLGFLGIDAPLPAIGGHAIVIGEVVQALPRPRQSPKRMRPASPIAAPEECTSCGATRKANPAVAARILRPISPPSPLEERLHSKAVAALKDYRSRVHS